MCVIHARRCAKNDASFTLESNFEGKFLRSDLFFYIFFSNILQVAIIEKFLPMSNQSGSERMVHFKWFLIFFSYVLCMHINQICICIQEKKKIFFVKPTGYESCPIVFLLQ